MCVCVYNSRYKGNGRYIEETMDNRKHQLVLKAFTDFENSPVAFAAPKLVYEYLKHNHPQIGITFREVQEFEREFVGVNQLLKNTKEGKEKGVPIVAYGLDDLWQADLVDTHDKHFVLARIDVTSRQGDLIWVSNKSGPAVFEAFKKLVFRNRGSFPNKLQTDKGSEFFNKWLRPFLNENGVNHFSGEGDRKSAMVERFNQTWQKFYYKYLESLPYQRNKQKVLDMVVSNYNRRPHSSLGGLAPSQVDLEAGNAIVRAQISQRENCRKAYTRKDKKKPSIVAYSGLRPGDTVRITKTRGPFFKQYRGTFSKEVFVVDSIVFRPTGQNTPLFVLRDLMGEQIKGVFYRRQLQKVRLPKHHKIEKVVRRGKQNQALVKLVNFPSEHSIWVGKREVRNGVVPSTSVRSTP